MTLNDEHACMYELIELKYTYIHICIYQCDKVFTTYTYIWTYMKSITNTTTNEILKPNKKI